MKHETIVKLSPGVYARGTFIVGDCPQPPVRGVKPVWIWMPVGVLTAICGALVALAAWCRG